tara:strand:- start:6761 stop:7090 length:330 start_codon:yes stop_codon:yes gene_type:complete
MKTKHIEKMDEKSRTRRREILDAALAGSRQVGYMLLTSPQLAERAGCTHGTIFNHFKDMRNLRRAIMQHAVNMEDAEVVLQGIVTRSHIAMAAPEGLKQKALAILNNEE